MKRIYPLLIIVATLVCASYQLISQEQQKINLTITEENLSPFSVICISDSCSLSNNEISEKLGSAYSELVQFMQNAKMDMTTFPMAITKQYDPQKGFYAFDAAFKVFDKQVKPVGRVKVESYPGGKAVKGVYVGPYENVTPAYEQIMKYMSEKGYKPGLQWEEYVNDPTTTPKEELITHIYWIFDK